MRKRENPSRFYVCLSERDRERECGCGCIMGACTWVWWGCHSRSTGEKVLVVPGLLLLAKMWTGSLSLWSAQAISCLLLFFFFCICSNSSSSSSTSTRPPLLLSHLYLCNHITSGMMMMMMIMLMICVRACVSSSFSSSCSSSLQFVLLFLFLLFFLSVNCSEIWSDLIWSSLQNKTHFLHEADLLLSSPLLTSSCKNQQCHMSNKNKKQQQQQQLQQQQ